MSSRRRSIVWFAGLLLIAGAPAPLAAQSVRVAVPEENFRKEPRVTGSNRLATVFEGTVLEVQGRQGRWISATLEGWIWSPSVEATDRDGFDLVVSASGGENLRDTPTADGRRVARLMRGMLLDRIGRQGNWMQVRRTAWLWAESAVVTEGGPSQASEPAAEAAAEEPPEQPAAAGLPDRIVVADRPLNLHVAPGGDTLATLRPTADLEVLARQGSWARVRLEGWVWVPATLPADSAAAGPSVAEVVANPDQYRGRRVTWRLQFVSVEQAEPARTDFVEGEPFLLTRAQGGDQGFVYVAVPQGLLTEVRQLRALQTIDVLGRVRTGRSALMGVPVIDLIALE